MSDQIQVCPPSVRHFFKDLRNKTKQVGDQFIFWKGCTRCTALMEIIVSHGKDGEGNIVPKMKAYIITAAGLEPVAGKVVEAEPPSEDEQPEA